VWGDSTERTAAFAAVDAEVPAAFGQLADRLTYAFVTHTRRMPPTADGRCDMAEAVTCADAYTDFSEVLSSVSRLFENRNGAVILLSDGRNNHGFDPLEVPLPAAVPLFVICMGDTADCDDWYIARWEQNAYAYRGSEFPVKVYVGHRSAVAGEAVAEERELAVARPQLEIRQGTRLLCRETVDAAALAGGLELYLPAADTGFQVYEMTLRVAQSECNAENNRRTFGIQVLNDKTVVRLLTSETHPDVGAIRRALAGDGRHELTVHPFEPALFDSLAADLWVLYGCPTAADGRRPSAMQALQRLVREKPVWFVWTPQTSPEAFNRLQTGLTMPLRPVFAETGAVYRSAFSYFGLEGVELIDGLPPLYTPLDLAAGQGAALLCQRVARLETTSPLWWFNLQGGRRIGVLTGQGVWRWRLWEQAGTGGVRLTDALIRRSVRLLSVKEDAERLQVQAEPFYGNGQTVEMYARLYDPGGWPVRDADVRAELRDSGGQEYRMAFVPVGDGYRLSADFLPAGLYTYAVSAVYGDMTERRQGFFRVREASVERTDLPADLDGMRRLAARCGGQAYYWDGRDRGRLRAIAREIGRQIAEQSAGQPQVRLRTEPWPLNQSVWWMLGLLALMGAEYALRRRYAEV
ncbi:MAG: hypothetical protein K2O01_04220, partial [Bacteroidales bacterium]|nr:hypothetical protein [Bacteroidales bacterium]